ncbi:MAG: lipoprotein insertase outer membrane protein LolB [Gammaproteobacteria bacterium]
MKARHAALGLLMLTACAQMPVYHLGGNAAIDQAWQRHRGEIDALRRWSLHGRVAVQTPRDGWQAGLQWRQAGEGFSLRIAAPLGQGTYGLDGDASGVVMRTPDNKSLTARDAETLLSEQLGWTLPVAGLHYWVRGIPDPEAPVSRLQLDPLGRMIDLEQSGWRISVLSYGHSGKLDLPLKLFLHSDELKVRMVVQSWEMG